MRGEGRGGEGRRGEERRGEERRGEERSICDNQHKTTNYSEGFWLQKRNRVLRFTLKPESFSPV
jgi:hypothetical protein